MANQLKSMDRGLELRVKGHLYELQEVDKDDKRGQHWSFDAYQDTLESVAECAGPAMLDEIADELKEDLQATGPSESRPDNQSLRKKAAKRLAEEDIVPDEYLLDAS